MAFALWRILRVQKSPGTYRHYAIGLFLLLLALNAAWSWMFFWAHSPLLGLINIVPQVVVILATIIRFARLDALAAMCLQTVAAWVSFDGVLNTAIWLLNS
jgi:tryptophan-rich sensory protein